MVYEVTIEEASQQYPEYEFVARLTPGAQKAAFHVRNQEGRDLCLKLIAPSYELARLPREVLAMQSVDHPNVARLIEYEFSARQDQQRHFLVEEYVTGTDLSTLLTEDGWDYGNAAKFFSQLASGLAAIGDAHIVHRDLKPSNIRVRPDMAPVIIDFGLARHLGLPDLTMTAEGAQIGTPLYFAPEQIHGTKHDIEARTDLFALGVLLYQALVGKHPFFVEGMNIDALFEAITTSLDCFEDESFLALPTNWKSLISRLLAKTRAERPINADQVMRVLHRLEETA